MKLVSGKSLLLTAAFLFIAAYGSYGRAESGPDSVELSGLASLYGSVIFDHAIHVELTGSNCARCHHHTTGMAPQDARCLKCHKGGDEAENVACRDCHAVKRFEADYLGKISSDPQLFHIDKPGLKGAFHRNCLGCHQESGGPTGCQDCHARNESGDALFHSGEFAPAEKTGKGGH